MHNLLTNRIPIVSFWCNTMGTNDPCASITVLHVLMMCTKLKWHELATFLFYEYMNILRNMNDDSFLDQTFQVYNVKMVKILASGEIVADDDPRAAGGGGAPNRRSEIPRQRQVTAAVDLCSEQFRPSPWTYWQKHKKFTFNCGNWLWQEIYN